MANRGNRVLLGVAVGWVAWFFARLLGADTAGQLVVLAVVAAATYALLTAVFAPRSQAGTDSSR